MKLSKLSKGQMLGKLHVSEKPEALHVEADIDPENNTEGIVLLVAQLLPLMTSKPTPTRIVKVVESTLPEVKAGDTVLLTDHGGTEIELQGDPHIVFDNYDMRGTLDAEA